MSYTLPKNYKGSPYFYENFRKGKVLVNDSIVANNVFLRFNMYANEIELKKDYYDKDENANPLTKSPSISVLVGDDKFVFIPYNGSIEKGRHFQVLYKGKKVALLKTIIKEYITPKKASSSITRNLKGAFRDHITYILVDKANNFYELPSKNRKKTLVFGSKKEEIDAFIQKYQLNLKKDKDLRSVVAYFDNL